MEKERLSFCLLVLKLVSSSLTLDSLSLLTVFIESLLNSVTSGTMQFSSRRKKLATNPQTELYTQPLQFYVQPPLENISLSEFETFAVDRLKCKTVVSFSEI